MSPFAYQLDARNWLSTIIVCALLELFTASESAFVLLDQTEAAGRPGSSALTCTLPGESVACDP